VVVGAVEAPDRSDDGLEQITAPDRFADGDRLGGVDRSRRPPPLEHPDLDAHAPLGSLLTLAWLGVDEVEVAHDDADAVEAERVQHASHTNNLPRRRS